MLFLANILQPLIDFFEAILVFFHDSVGFGWGFSIIAMTIVVRAALLPLTVKQFKSMQNLVKHQPELKKLQDKYKGDRERLQQETMKFYRENKVNPFASCLPLLAQIPVFISLFYMLRADLRNDVCPGINPKGTENPKPCGETPASEFFFIPDITDKATGSVLLVLIVLYVGSQLASSLLSMQNTTDKMQRNIFLALPFFFVPFILSFPAGLLIYWITTNLWTIVQQTIIRRRLGPLRPEGAEPSPGLGDLFKQAREGTSAVPREASSNGSDKPKGRTTAAPPPPPRKKKKRSGRRR